MQKEALFYKKLDDGKAHCYPCGNLPQEETATVCPHCSTNLIRRLAYFVKENRLSSPRCPSCGGTVAGLFARPST